MPDEIAFQNDPVDPGCPGSWLIEDEYMLGTELLVAPLFELADRRRVYLPPGRWRRFESGAALTGPGWHTASIDQIPAGLLVREGARLQLAEPAQHTGELDWEGARGWRPKVSSLR